MTAAGWRRMHHGLAFLWGGLLAGMLLLNGTLAGATIATFASLAAHGSGAALALAIPLALPRASAGGSAGGPGWRNGAPAWACLGGISGALTVIVTALSGTLALGLAGQAGFAPLADRLGLFGLPMRRVSGVRDGRIALIVDRS